MTALCSHLRRYNPADWRKALDILDAGMHPIDRDATRIWFAFFPLALHAALEQAADPAALARDLRLMGRWRLADQVNESHRFLFSHRYWPQVKLAIETADRYPDALAELITVIADSATRRARVDRDQLLGLTAIGLMTARQAGPDAFRAAVGRVVLPPETRARSAHQVTSARERNDRQGPLGWLRGLRKQWTVTFDESDPTARFTVLNDQEVASTGRGGSGDFRSRDPRCIPGEGPIPVECRAGSCGTCWVGVLGGRDRLSPVADRDERQRMRVFGYLDSAEPQPLIRLACQARATGAVSIVIPPWNGMIGGLGGG